MRKFLLALFGLILLQHLEGQVAIGEWREHLSYRQGTAVCKAGNRIYCATFPSLFYFNTDDNSIEKVSKVDGLSDLEVNVVKYSEAHDAVIVGYSNGNIDIIKDDNIYNIPDVKRSFIQGSKAINEVLIHNDIAYVSAGFGVLELNIAQKEIKETFTLGQDGAKIVVNECTVKNDSLFAATSEGIYKGSLSDNLVDFQNWTKLEGLPEGNYNTIVTFNNELLTNFRKEGTWNEDTIYRQVGNSWQKQTVGNAYNYDNLNDFNVDGNELLAAFAYGGRVCDVNYNELTNIWTYGEAYTAGVQPGEIIADGNTYWIADKYFALVHRKAEFSHEVYTPTGPIYSDTWGLHYNNGYLWASTGTLTPNMKSSFNDKGIAVFHDNYWVSYYGTSTYDSLRDIHAIISHPDDPQYVFAASYFGGLLEFKDGQPVKIHNETNSAIQSIKLFPWRGIGGMAFDKNKMLWMSNSGLTGEPVDEPLLVYDLNGNWRSYDLNSQLDATPLASKVIIDDYGTKWIQVYLKGIIAFNENGTLDDESDDQLKVINSSSGSGNLPNNEVHAMAIDQDGKLWIGGSEGLVVINLPQNVFTEGVSAERIIIEDEEGNANYLLSDEIITSIKIDAGNRKWIATQGAGVYLMSADMQQEIYHFNTLNSPLISDIVYDVEIDSKTGEVYFSTDKGLVSFMSTATDSTVYDGPVYAYPNPVPPDFNGTIGIRGLVNNAEVKITDITGNLVYETIAEGGTAAWNGNNMNGQRVQTGVYLVLSSNTDGSDTQITKILFIN